VCHCVIEAINLEDLPFDSPARKLLLVNHRNQKPRRTRGMENRTDPNRGESKRPLAGPLAPRLAVVSRLLGVGTRKKIRACRQIVFTPKS